MLKRYTIHVSGRVQGVGYRYFAKSAADSLGIYGQVRNNNDGTVTVLAEGEEEILEPFLAQLGKGPPFSSVEHVSISEGEASGEYTAFSIRG